MDLEFDFNHCINRCPENRSYTKYTGFPANVLWAAKRLSRLRQNLVFEELESKLQQNTPQFGIFFLIYHKLVTICSKDPQEA